MSVLVTGGAGYIGSHTVHQLVEAGHKVVVIDNFYSGHRWATHPQAKLIEADAGDARAHLDALAYLDRKGDSATFNCGYSNGFSVRDVLETVQKVSGVDFLICEEKRRAGDPVSLTANADRIRQVHNDLELNCRSAYHWESQLSGHAKVAV